MERMTPLYFSTVLASVAPRSAKSSITLTKRLNSSTPASCIFFAFSSVRSAFHPAATARSSGRRTVAEAR